MIQRVIFLAATLVGGAFAVLPVPTARAEDAAPPPLPGPKAGGPVETLWVADQFTGMLGMWTRRQQRWLITPEKVFHQDLHLKVGDWTEFESMDATFAVVRHHRSEHGGVIELGAVRWESLLLVQEFDEAAGGYQERERSVEQEEETETEPVLAYRWLEGGRADVALIYGPAPEYGSPDPKEVLVALADRERFAAMKGSDEPSLIPEDPAYWSLAELRRLTGGLKEFKAGDAEGFAAISDALDRRWKAAEKPAVPAGVFADTHRFARLFHGAAIEGGYNPFTGAFAFAEHKALEDLEGEEPAVIAALRKRFVPYTGSFEGGLRALVASPEDPERLPALAMDGGS